MILRLYACAFFLFLTGCRSSVERTFPKRESISEPVYASGVIKGRDQYQAHVNAAGIVQEVFVEEGDLVRAGPPILSVYNESAWIGRESADHYGR
jgi:HlyD family secretion protein